MGDSHAQAVPVFHNGISRRPLFLDMKKYRWEEEASGVATHGRGPHEVNNTIASIYDMGSLLLKEAAGKFVFTIFGEASPTSHW